MDTNSQKVPGLRKEALLPPLGSPPALHPIRAHWRPFAVRNFPDAVTLRSPVGKEASHFGTTRIRRKTFAFPLIGQLAVRFPDAVEVVTPPVPQFTRSVLRSTV